VKKTVIPFLALISLLWISLTQARVTGVCSNCHTMHFSQSSWPQIWGSEGPNRELLVKDCIGCHSNTTSETIKVIGPAGAESRVPVVYNTVEPSYSEESIASGNSNTLAGGNFYWVEHVGDEYGHNVISHADSVLTEAPGRNQGCTNSCHFSLYSWRFPWPNSEGKGCTSCHTPAHHKAGSTTAVADEEDGWYRFLARRHAQGPDSANRNVIGLEDSDWQQTVSPNDHNEYWDNWTYGCDNGGISRFCAACHGQFHSTRYGPWTNGGFKTGPGGGWHTAPWLRHPAGIYLPDFGETSKYNTDGSGPEGVTGPYNPIAPVSRQNIETFTSPSDTVTVGSGGDMVSCLSCHRAHGSPYPDMLRWDYTQMIAGGGQGCAEGEGCFICHTQKDD